MIGLIASAISGVVKVGSLIAKGVKAAKPVIKIAAGAGTIAAGASLGQSAISGLSNVIGGNKNTGLVPYSGGLPALSGVGAGAGGAVGVVPTYSGMPSSRHPIVPAAALRQFAIPTNYLRTFVRAPRGACIVHDEQGAFAVPIAVARQYGYKRPTRKPPISAGDWHKYQTAQRVEKKLVKIAGKALRKHRRPPAAKGGKRR